MKELTKDELKDVQLQIMDYVDHFCRSNNIQYTLSCGTLLGAVRHGGFIPWDDDIDIHLLRSEYNKLTQLWNESKFSHPYELVNIESGNNMGYPFGKIHNPKTITYVNGIERTGVFIDVFPIDYVEDYSDFNKRHGRIMNLYKKRDNCFAWMSAKKSDIPFFQKMLVFLHKPRLGYNEIAEEISKIAQSVSCKTDYVYEMVQGIFPKDLIPSEVYEHYSDIKFEDRIYRSVDDTETYLTKTYGDWRTPPPPEKQVSHHGFSAYWK